MRDRNRLPDTVNKLTDTQRRGRGKGQMSSLALTDYYTWNEQECTVQHWELYLVACNNIEWNGIFKKYGITVLYTWNDTVNQLNFNFKKIK